MAFPLTIYLVQLCDGSTIYVIGADLLNQIDGPYTILDEIVLNSPEQELEVVITLRRPLFAMKFENYEPNGNIKELRWKIIRCEKTNTPIALTYPLKSAIRACSTTPKVFASCCKGSRA